MKECYIDMHCHILPGVDDGAKDLAETKKMLEIAYAEGIRCIIATPHHHPHRGKAPAEKLRERAKLVREAAHEIDERFRVYLGTEVYFGQDVADKLKEGKILSMNRREYVLVEFPPSQTYSYIRQGIQQLQFAGYEVILAHVERYHCIAENVELAEELYDMGVNLQVNADSITGGSGRKIRKSSRTDEPRPGILRRNRCTRYKAQTAEDEEGGRSRRETIRRRLYKEDILQQRQEYAEEERLR